MSAGYTASSIPEENTAGSDADLEDFGRYARISSASGCASPTSQSPCLCSNGSMVDAPPAVPGNIVLDAIRARKTNPRRGIQRAENRRRLGNFATRARRKVRLTVLHGAQLSPFLSPVTIFHGDATIEDSNPPGSAPLLSCRAASPSSRLIETWTRWDAPTAATTCIKDFECPEKSRWRNRGPSGPSRPCISIPCSPGSGFPASRSLALTTGSRLPH